MIKTWADLAKAIAGMSPSELEQDVKCVLSTNDDSDVQEALIGIAIGSVKDLGFAKYRSTVDNKYRGDDIVLLLDYNPFAEDGALLYDFEDGTPVYGVHGKTDPKEQCKND